MHLLTVLKLRKWSNRKLTKNNKALIGALFMNGLRRQRHTNFGMVCGLFTRFSIDKNGKIKLIHARGVGKSASESSLFLPPEKYRDSEFYGYYRAVNETEDGKLDNETSNNNTNNNSNERDNQYINDKYQSAVSWLQLQILLRELGQRSSKQIEQQRDFRRDINNENR